MLSTGSTRRMRRRSDIPVALVMGGLLGTALVAAPPAFAAATDITISMDPAPATPRINGAKLIGYLPGSPMLHTISATGSKPITFAAEGLPTGISLDAATGTLTGTVPEANSYPIVITATNSAGSAKATLTLRAGATLALTPPMGWNSYDSFIANVKEADVKAATDAMKTYLQPYGWNTVVIDYLWYDPEQQIDANGRWLPSPSKYPSAAGTFKAMAEYVHSKGMHFGIHLMRGVPRKSFTANSPIANSTYTASQAGNSGDTCSWDNHMYGVRGDTAAGKAWYDSIYKQYAEWGVDFVKVDDMMNPYGGNVSHNAEIVAVHESLVKTGRSIVFSLSPGPFQTKDSAVLNANANMWRQVNDFWDNSGSLSSMSNEFDAAYNWSVTNGITQGHWPDADMLPLGTIGNRPCAFSKNQQVQVMTLWAIMPSPLMFGGMPIKLNNDAWTVALLTNDEILAVNQDELGARGKRLAKQGSTEVWAKDLSGGRKAVALFNRGAADASMSVTFADLGMTGTPAVRDCWRKQDLAGATTGISVNVPHDSALMYVVGTATTGTGGAVATGGATATGGAIATGGVTATGGAARTGGSLSTGGVSTVTGGAPASGGMTVATGGVTGATGGVASTGGVVPGAGGNSSPSGGSRTGGTGAVASGGSSGTVTGGVSSPSGGGSTAGTGGASTSTGGATKSGTGGSTTVTPFTNGTDNGCSCAVGGRPDTRGTWVWTIGVLGIAVLIRRRRG